MKAPVGAQDAAVPAMLRPARGLSAALGLLPLGLLHSPQTGDFYLDMLRPHQSHYKAV